MVSWFEIKLKRLTFYWYSYSYPASQIRSTYLFQFRINSVTKNSLQTFYSIPWKADWPIAKTTQKTMDTVHALSGIWNVITLSEQFKTVYTLYYVTTVININIIKCYSLKITYTIQIKLPCKAQHDVHYVIEYGTKIINISQFPIDTPELVNINFIF